MRTRYAVTTAGTALDLGSSCEVRAVRVGLSEVGRRQVRVEGGADEGWFLLAEPDEAGRSPVWSRAVSGTFRHLRLVGPDAGGCALQVWYEPWSDLTRDLLVEATSAHPWHPPAGVLGEQVSRTWVAAADDPDPALLLTVPPGARAAVVDLTCAPDDGTPLVEVVSGDGWVRATTELVGPGPRLRAPVPPEVRRVRVRGVRQLHQIRVLGSPAAADADLTSGPRLRATSHRDDHEPRHALQPGDGSWAPDPLDPDPWLVVDLGRPCTVTTVEAEPVDGDARAPAVELSVDGERWSPFAAPASDVGLVRVGGRGCPGVRRLRVRGHGSPRREPWWERGSPVVRFFPKQYGVRFDDVAAALPDLQRQGFRVIELAGVKQGPPSAFAGLGATDDFAVDERLGSLADLQRLLRRAHDRSTAVVVFDNLGYAHRTAPAFRAAAARVAADPSADGYPFLLSRRPGGERWFRDPDSGVWYFAFWGEDLPSYDWNREQWRRQSSQILRFWMSQQIDGFGVDAPRAYPGADADSERRHIGEVLATGGVWRFAEGIDSSPSGGPQREWQRTVAEQGFTTVLDLSISVWHDPGRNQLVPAVRAGHPGPLEQLLGEGRDAVAAVGGTTIEAPAWEADLLGDGVVPADRRLLEIACLATCGSMFYLTDGVHTYRPEVDVVPGWSPAQRQRLDALLGAVGSEAALGPAGLRLPLPTADPRHLVWLRTDGSGALAAVVVLSFATESTTVTADLTTAAVTELGPELTGAADEHRPDARLEDGTLQLALPARGFAAFGVW